MKHGVICLLMACAGLVASCASLDKLMAIEVNTKNQSYWDKEQFMEEYALSEAEYTRWKKEVLGALSDPQSVDPLVAESKQVVYQTIRVEIPSQEEIIGTREGGIIILTDMAMYRIYRRPISSSSYDRGCHKVNYESLAVSVLNRYSGKRGFNSESWTYDDFLKIGKIASEKLETILTEKQEKKLAEEQKIIEAKEKKRAEELAAQEASEKQEIATLLAWDDTEAKSRAEKMNGQTIVFKSLYLGMPIEDAMHLVYKDMQEDEEPNFVYPHVLTATQANNILAQFMIAKAAMNEENLYVIVVSVRVGAGNTVLHGMIEATPDGKVVKFLFDNVIVDGLFGSQDLDATNFIKQFRSAYKVPSMELVDDSWANPTWSCTTKGGAKLTVTHKKIFLLEQVPSRVERKNAFD